MLLLFCQCESLPLTGWFQSKSSSAELLLACQTVPFRGLHDTRPIHSAIGCSCSSHMYVLTDQVYFSLLMLCASSSTHTCMHAHMHARTHARTHAYTLTHKATYWPNFWKASLTGFNAPSREVILDFICITLQGKRIYVIIYLSLYIYVIICRYASVSFNVSSPLWCSV